MTEEDIKSYMKQFSVNRDTAIKEIKNTLDYYYKEEDKKIQEVYHDIIKSSY